MSDQTGRAAKVTPRWTDTGLADASVGAQRRPPPVELGSRAVRDRGDPVAVDQDDLLTVEEAARRLRIGRTKMYGLLSSGEVESITIGTRRLVPPECVEEFIQRRRREQAHRQSTTPAA
jgi:excisionase family DNA binding protein